MNKTVKPTWEEVDKEGYVLNGFTKSNNSLSREIINKTDPQTAMLYIVILSHRNSLTNKCYPSISLLAREMGLADRTVSRMIKKLVEEGFLIVNSGRQGISSDYFFPREDWYNNEGVVATKRSGKLK